MQRVRLLDDSGFKIGVKCKIREFFGGGGILGVGIPSITRIGDALIFDRRSKPCKLFQRLRTGIWTITTRFKLVEIRLLNASE